MNDIINIINEEMIANTKKHIEALENYLNILREHVDYLERRTRRKKYERG